jgi:hypothetical protein
MNDLIQSLPSPLAYSRNYSHMDGGIIDGWWRGVSDDDGDDLLQIPIPAGCQNRVSGSESGFLVVAVQWNSIWKNVKPPDVFRLEAICRWKKGSRRWLRRPHHPLARPGLAHATRWCGTHMALLHLIFRLYESSGKIGALWYFLGFFLKVGFLHKNETSEQFCWKQR